jgi:post-segregation antitoxin (ccd killing protein)
MGRLKQKVYINLPHEIVEKARKHGLNISKVSENALVAMIDRIEAPKNLDSQSSPVNASQERLNGASGGIWTRDLRLTKPSQ